MKLSLVFMTGRADPHLEWVIEGLHQQAQPEDEIELIVVDALGRPASEIGFQWVPCISDLVETRPKPNLWQGPHRVTEVDWWATANSRNTGIALASNEYVAFLDDRSRLGEAWLATVREHDRRRSSVICGTYDKLEGSAAEGLRTTIDHRREHCPTGKINCGGGWLYGCTFALPLAWALEVNGFEEGCDGLTGEDYIFGLMLGNAGRRIDFLPQMAVHQDRTRGNESCKGSYRCTDKGKSPNDKSHAALRRFGGRKRTELTPDLRALRAELAAGGTWPVPDPAVEHRDWYDGQLIREMT